MTKEDMILWAEFMAGYDVNQTPMAGLYPGDLIPCEAGEVWSCGLIMKHDGKEVCVLPNKSKGMVVETFVWLEKKELDEYDEDWDCCYNVFGYYDWIPTDEELVAEIKRQDFCATWTQPGELKYIILKKWPDAFNDD